ncbi:MAG: hypothetical protein FWD32_02595 [Firmicutes bacterium]|nr:hypothetical protein [Bacillota bacterium]
MVKMRRSTKTFFWLTIISFAVSMFLLFTLSGRALRVANGGWLGFAPLFISAVLAFMLGCLFGFLSFVRFIRSKSIAGGLLATMVITTALFFAANTFFINPPALFQNVAAAGMASTVGGPVITPLTGLAQIGLFALWFLVLLVAIYAQTRPVKKLENALDQLLENPEQLKFNVGKGKQFLSIEKKLNVLAHRLTHEKLLKELQEKKRAESRAKRASQKATLDARVITQLK